MRLWPGQARPPGLPAVSKLAARGGSRALSCTSRAGAKGRAETDNSVARPILHRRGVHFGRQAAMQEDADNETALQGCSRVEPLEHAQAVVCHTHLTDWQSRAMLNRSGLLAGESHVCVRQSVGHHAARRACLHVPSSATEQVGLRLSLALLRLDNLDASPLPLPPMGAMSTF
jgi:hypothetical protein